MARDVMAVRLHLSQIRVLEVLEDTPGVLVVKVESTVRRLRCPHCGFGCGGVHDRHDKQVRDLEVSGRRRFSCGNCGERFMADHRAFEGRLIARLVRRLVADVKVMTVAAAARRHKLSWHVVMALVRSWSELVAEHRRNRRCRVLLVDETSMRRRHRHVTVIVSGDTGRTLAMVPHRTAAPLLSAGSSPPRGAAGVEASRWWSQTARAPTSPPSMPTSATHAMCWTALMSPDGSQPGSQQCAATSSAASPQAANPPSSPRCSEPDSLCCAEPTPSQTPTGPASSPSSATTHGSDRAGRPCNSSTAYTSRRRPPRCPRSARPVLRPLRDRRAARVSRHRRHHHRLVRRDPRLALHRPGLQRQNRGHQHS